MKSVKVVKVIFVAVAVFTALLGIYFMKRTYEVVQKGYEEAEFVVTDYEITDITKETKRTKRNGKTRRTTTYDIDYHVEYEYTYNGQTYTYETNKSINTKNQNKQPCAVGDIDKYYINPKDPGNTADIMSVNTKYVGPIMFVISAVFLLCAIFVKKMNRLGERSTVSINLRA